MKYIMRVMYHVELRVYLWNCYDFVYHLVALYNSPTDFGVLCETFQRCSFNRTIHDIWEYPIFS